MTESEVAGLVGKVLIVTSWDLEYILRMDGYERAGIISTRWVKHGTSNIRDEPGLFGRITKLRFATAEEAALLEEPTFAACGKLQP